MVIRSIFYFFLIFLFFGCSSKNFFTPKTFIQIDDFSSRIVASVYDKTPFALTLSDGSILTKDAKRYFLKLPKEYRVVNSYRDIFIALSKDGGLKLLKDQKILFEKKYHVAVASASLDDNLLAIVLSNNKIILHDIENNKVLFKKQLNQILTLDARVANPYFLNDLIIFPTLDGRLLVIKRDTKEILRDIVVSTHENFNNIIFLNVKNNTIIAATQNRVISIDPKGITSFDRDLKDILLLDNKVYIFTKNGEIVLLDMKLNVIKKRKFAFANFSYATKYQDHVVAVLKNGYLIVIDKNLDDYVVYKLPQDSIHSFVFATKDKLYIGSEYLYLKDIVKKR